MGKDPPGVVPVLVPLRQQALTEPRLGIVWVNDLCLKEALVRQLSIVKAEVEVAEVSPSDGVLQCQLNSKTTCGGLLTFWYNSSEMT